MSTTPVINTLGYAKTFCIQHWLSNIQKSRWKDLRIFGRWHWM